MNNENSLILNAKSLPLFFFGYKCHTYSGCFWGLKIVPIWTRKTGIDDILLLPHLRRRLAKIFNFKHTQMPYWLSGLVKFFSNRWSVRAWVVVTCMSLPGWSCQLKELGSIGGHMCLSLFLKLCRMIVILSLFSKNCRTFVFVFVFETLQDTCVCLCIYNIAGRLCLRGPMTLQ